MTKSRLTPEDMVVAIADLIDSIGPEETNKEIDAALREFGYCPEDLRARIKAVAERALAERQKVLDDLGITDWKAV